MVLPGPTISLPMLRAIWMVMQQFQLGLAPLIMVLLIAQRVCSSLP